MGGIGKVFKGLGKALGGALKVALPLAKNWLSKLNPAFGIALNAFDAIRKGGDPIKTALGAASEIFKGGGPFKNLLSKFGGSEKFMESMVGNRIAGAALDLAPTSKSKTEVAKEIAKRPMTPQSHNNLVEMLAQSMSQLLQRSA